MVNHLVTRMNAGPMAETVTARTRIRSNPNWYAEVLEIRAVTCFQRDFTIALPPKKFQEIQRHPAIKYG